PILMVLDRIKYEHSAIGRFVSDPPGLIEFDGIIEHVFAVGRVDGYNCDLRMCLFVDLFRDAIQLVFRLWAENMGEVVYVIGGVKSGNGLRESSRMEQRKCNYDDDQARTPHRAD